MFSVPQRLTVLITLVAFTTVACSPKLVRKDNPIPDSQYQDVLKDGGRILITTHAGASIDTDSYDVTDDGLLIKVEFVDGTRRSVLAYSIKFDEIQSIYGQELHTNWTPLIVTLAVLGAAVLLVYILGRRDLRNTN